MLKRTLTVTVLTVLFTVSSALADYPNKPVRIIVPYSPGGTSDFVARISALKISETTGKQFYVENKTGAAGVIGYDAGAKAQPDGYTLVASDSSYTILPSLNSKLPWNHASDLVPVTVTAQTPVVIVVNSNTNLKTLKDLIDFAKANPGKLNFGSGGVGSVTHLAAEVFKTAAGIEITHIPFKGAGEAMTGVLSGTVELLITAAPTAMSHVSGGRVTALAVSGSSRSTALPNVPSTSEAGVPGYDFMIWFGLMAPKGTPEPMIAFVQKSVSDILKSPDIKEKLATQGAEGVGSSPQEAAKQVAAETARWTGVIARLGLKAE